MKKIISILLLSGAIMFSIPSIKAEAIAGNHYVGDSHDASIVNYNAEKFFQLWDRCDGVKDLQMRLSRIGYGYLDKDGIYGPATKDAVMKFQRSYGLNADGLYGPSTHRVLINGCNC
ncbi:peptidoglycan-binding domain-containing protein [Clostridium frigidicarnis]|uniref:Putative peptidoglycan binding domain-containing protein n=1 Tax=Clostridium frigidicarnis TaxID=84698 RepID=A0A1I0YVF2_9CLOT|nr:peptidoglycan-binding domain-containing protein [Clostridium frigidicarnis]SFB17369.1 Putative peptidoglycan binding domain-containing protein [Clostridium frigidicarnis]